MQVTPLSFNQFTQSSPPTYGLTLPHPGSFDGKTALQLAAKQGHLDIVQALVGAGANLEAASTDQYQRTPLHCAAYSGNFNVVQFLVSAGARLESMDADGISALTLGECNPALHIAISQGQAASYGTRLELSPSKF